MRRLCSLLLAAALAAALLAGCASGGSSHPASSLPSRSPALSAPSDTPVVSPALPGEETTSPPAGAGDASQPPQEEPLPSFTGGELLTGELSSMAAPIQALTRAMAELGYTYDPYLPVFFWNSLKLSLSLGGLDHSLIQNNGEELQVPRQAAQEFAAALFLNYGDLLPLPGSVSGVRYDDAWDAYFVQRLTGQAAVRTAVTQVTAGGRGSWLVDVSALQGETPLCSFRFTLVPNPYADGIAQPAFLYTVSAVECLSQEGSLTYSTVGRFESMLDAGTAGFDCGGESYRIFRLPGQIAALLEGVSAGREVSLTYTVDFSTGACTVTSLSLAQG